MTPEELEEAFADAHRRPAFNLDIQSIALPDEAFMAHPLMVRSVDATANRPCQIIAEIDGREVGRLSITAVPLVHDLEIAPSAIQRKIADALFFYASGKVKAAGFSEAVVCVAKTNEKMQRYVEERATKEEESAVYMMGVL